jgi:aromatic-L-amino-acid decarboxylase
MSAEPPSDGSPLEPSRATHEAWLRVLADFALDEVHGLGRGPAVGAVGAAGLDVADAVSRPIPEQPLEGGVEAVTHLLRQAARASLVPPGPGYFAYVPGTGLFSAALADLVSGSLNRFTGLSAAAPALCRLEADVIAWLARECGYGDEARGVLLSGSSLANLVAVTTAREERFGDSGDLRRAVGYCSPQAHGCVDRAFRLSGVPGRNVRRVDVDDQWRMDPAALDAALNADRTAGLEPFVVVVSAGTTNTGALDPLDEIADVCTRHHVWMHVDGAYGGAFVLCDEGRRLLSGMGRADSIALDPHKGLHLPFGTGCLLVREGARLRRAHTAHADRYLQDFDALERSREAPSPTEHGPELSRSYRGLRLWLPLMLHGAAAFRQALEEKLELARVFHAGLLAAIDRGAPLVCVAPPHLSTVAFRLARREGEPLDAWNARNAALLERINASRRVYLSSTTLPVEDGDAFTLRVCVLGARTHARHVQSCLTEITRAVGAA